MMGILKFILAVVILLGSGLLTFLVAYAIWMEFRDHSARVPRFRRRPSLPLRSPSARAKAAAFTRQQNREAARRKAKNGR
jgi:hypothetical protein